jgi:hypothetical protein
LFKYRSFNKRFDRQTDLHGEVGYRWSHINEEIDIDHPEKPVGTFQVGVCRIAKSYFSIFKRKPALAGISNSFIIEHGAKLENANQITHYPLNSLFLLPHDNV